MYQRDQIIEQLGIQQWPKENQDKAVELGIYRIGLAITKLLTEQQFNEYTAIVNDNKEVIDGWLEANVPDYKESPVYQQFVAGYEDDPEKNRPEKLFASVAWVQMHVPNLQDVIAETLAVYKKELGVSQG